MANLIQILHLEDNSGDRELVRSLLAEAGLVCEFAYAQARKEFAEALTSRQWDVILADYSLPAFDGYAALDIARKMQPQIPFIFVTGAMGEEVAVETLKRGATDYVVKQRFERLVPAVKRALSETDAKRRLIQTQDKLSRTEQRFRLLVDSIKEYAIYMVKDNSEVLSWNCGAKRIFGYAEDEIQGGSILSIFSDSGGRDTFERLVHTAQRCGQAEEELWLVRKDGTSFCATVLFTSVFDAPSGLHGFAVITQDITERKRVAMELEENRKERERMQDRFLSHISHELRSPLTSIVDFTSLIEEGLAGEISGEQRNYLGIVLTSANRLAVMVNSLLDLARSEWHRLPVNPECISLEGLVSQACNSLQSAAHGKNISLRYRVPDDLPAVYADSHRILEVLTNLIDNAIKYGNTGGEVEVTVHSCAAEPDFIRVAVRDNGPGIAPKHLERIFERFYRASEGPDTNPTGLGLGLYITRELVRAHGGELGVSSTLASGTKFQFTLPIFRLHRNLIPVISQKTLSIGKLALITITIPSMPNCSALDMGRYLRSVREIVQSCTYASEDLILPQMNTPALYRKIHVVAFVHEAGAHAMVNRLEEHLDRSTELQPLEGRFDVSTSMLDFADWELENPQEVGARLAAELSRLIGLDDKHGGKSGNSNGDDEHDSKQGAGNRGQPGAPYGVGDQVASTRI